MTCGSPITIALVFAFAAACGGSSASGPAADGGGAGDDVAGEASTTGADGGSDAEPPDNGPWPAAHYPMPLMTHQGGAVLTAPRLVTVTFVDNPDRDALRTFDDAFAESTPWWSAVTAGYGVGAATSGGHYELPDTLSNTSLDDDQGQLGKMVAQWVASGALPVPDANTVFILYIPVSTTLTFQGGAGCNYFSAYHNSVQIAGEGGTVQAVYAAIVNCPQPPATDQDMAQTTNDVSHEIIEAATDPHANMPAWYGYNNAWFRVPGSAVGQGEVADVCVRYAPFTDASGDTLARSWVNAAAMASSDPCQPELPGETFYAVAVPTQVVPTQTIGIPNSDGYIVVARGTTKTVDAVVFSEAKLPTDVQLSVGGRSRGQPTLDPSLGTGITTSLSPTAGHNGVHVTLTIEVDSTATPKDYYATARAALSSTDHHDWPFILRVQ